MYNHKRKSAVRNTKQTHYLIITTGEKTEMNYFRAFYDNRNDRIQKCITIDYEVCTIDNITKKANYKESKYPTATKVWLVFDTDRDTSVIKKIINGANNNGYNIAFSNPCIEIWFLAYFGKSLSYKNNANIVASQQCIRDLKQHIPNYEKNDKTIYKLLTTQGNEEVAIKTAKDKHLSYKQIHILNMYGATNIYKLVEELKFFNSI